MNDRTVHAQYDGMDIVRYDRAGKWYLEPHHAILKRQHVTIAQAVASAKWGIANANGEWFKNRRGGSTFDAKMAAFP